MAKRLLFQDLDSDVADLFEVCDRDTKIKGNEKHNNLISIYGR